MTKTELLILLKKLSFKPPFKEFLLQDINLAIHPGDKIALIGPNGCGKSTLLKMISGEITPTKGAVETYGKIVYLPQVHFSLDKDLEVYQFISQLTENWWEVMFYAQQKFNFPEISPNRKVNSLSGGELMKLYLSKFLMSEPDILLLDEPTNHIDVSSMAVLVDVLKNFQGAIIAATHDTFFINQFATKVVEIENKNIQSYGGNYDLYMGVKLQMDDAYGRKLFATKYKFNRIKRALKIEERRAERSRQVGISMRGDRSMARAEIGFFKDSAQKSTNKISKALYAKKDKIQEKLEKMEKPEIKPVEFQFLSGLEGMEQLISITSGVLKVDQMPLIKDIEFSISKGERVIILGNNGVGKTLFLRSLMGKNKQGVALTGEILRNEDLKGEYIGQEFDSLVIENKKGRHSVSDSLKSSKERVYKNVVGHMKLEDTDLIRPIDSFSGGELTKLALLDIAKLPLDLLILDEPTNHLDIMSQDALLNALAEYSGALIVTSHKLEFLSELGATAAYIIKDGEFRPFTGDREDPKSMYKALKG